MEPFEESSSQSCGCLLTAGKYTQKKSEEARSHAPPVNLNKLNRDEMSPKITRIVFIFSNFLPLSPMSKNITNTTCCQRMRHTVKKTKLH